MKNVSKLPLSDRLELSNNPNTPTDTLVVLSQDSVFGVRCRVASNPNTPTDTLVVLSQDSNWSVRHGVTENREVSIGDTVFYTTEKYAAIQGTNHIWYKHFGNVEKPPFYTCGCFIGNRDQLLTQIHQGDRKVMRKRLTLLDWLDTKGLEMFGR